MSDYKRPLRKAVSCGTQGLAVISRRAGSKRRRYNSCASHSLHPWLMPLIEGTFAQLVRI